VNLLNTDGMWQELLKNKYLQSKFLTQVKAKLYDSHFWRGLMKIKDEVLTNGTFFIKDGSATRFWEDTWVGNMSFKDRYPSLYNIVRDPHATVTKIMASQPLNISFRRTLLGPKLRDWSNLVAQIAPFNLVDGSDSFRWNLTKSGLFTVRSMYLHLINTHTPFRHKKIWKIKAPLEIKIFLWYLQKEVVLTKDNLARKNWKGSQKCVGCNLDESIQYLFLDCHYATVVWRMVYLATGLTQPKSIRHLFGSWLSNQNTKIRDLIWVGVAALCWAIWNTRNDIIFNRIKYNSILQLIFRGTYWLRFWAQLQRDEHNKNVLSSLSTRIEMVSLEQAHGGWKHLYRLC